MHQLAEPLPEVAVEEVRLLRQGPPQGREVPVRCSS